MEEEYTEEHLEYLKHEDFKNSKHKKGCGCGYCQMKKLGVRIL